MNDLQDVPVLHPWD